MKRVVLVLAVMLALAAYLPSSSLALDGIAFKLGFKALADMIPGAVGTPLENEHWGDNGDSLQKTTVGLMVWRKADNWTAFTDGSRSWVNGPLGLQTRGNGERFSWEQNPDQLTIVPRPVPGDRCHTSGLAVQLSAPKSQDGREGARILIKNVTQAACTINGYPGMEMLDARNDGLPTRVVRGGNTLYRDPGPVAINLQPGRTAFFEMDWITARQQGEPQCPRSVNLKVTPPDEWTSLIERYGMAPCVNGTIHVTAIQRAD